MTNGAAILLLSNQLKSRATIADPSAEIALCVPGMGTFGLQECKSIILRVKIPYEQAGIET